MKVDDLHGIHIGSEEFFGEPMDDALDLHVTHELDAVHKHDGAGGGSSGSGGIHAVPELAKAFTTWRAAVGESQAALAYRDEVADHELGHDGHLSLVLVTQPGPKPRTDVNLVNWLRPATQFGQRVVLDATNHVKWSVQAPGQFPGKSFLDNTEVIVADCGVRMLQAKHGRPLSPPLPLRLWLMYDSACSRLSSGT